MSGGALNYAHLRLQDTAELLARYSHGREDSNALAAFAGYLQRVAEVLRSIEYDLSDDESLSKQDYALMARMVESLKEI